MSNMSYCRWNNTYRDYSDCLSDLQYEMEENGLSFIEYLEQLSIDEAGAMKRLIWLSRELVRIVDSEENN